jgi:hypothetical protein
MHFRQISGNGTALHQRALLLITIGFLGLAAARLALGGGARIAVSMCLALFAMSFVHFGTGHAGQAWSSELVIHPAGIPLALFVLLQACRFALRTHSSGSECAAGRRADVARDSGGIPAAPGGARGPDPLQEALLLTSVSVSGFLRLAAQPCSLVAEPGGLPAGQRRAVAGHLRDAPAFATRRGVPGGRHR